MNTCRPSRPSACGARVWALLVGVLIAVGLLGFTAGTPSAVTRAAAETRVGAFTTAPAQFVGPITQVSPVQGRVDGLSQAPIVVATGVAAESVTTADRISSPLWTATKNKTAVENTTRRRQRVVKALNEAVNTGEEITASGIARRAGVDRTFLYRHRDLLEQVHAAEAQPHDAPGVGPVVSRASLQADLHAAQQRSARMAARVQLLQTRLSELLGEQAWRQSGLGAPDDIDQLKQQNIQLEQHVIDLRLQLEERDQELAAARTANRELITQLNASRHTP